MGTAVTERTFEEWRVTGNPGPDHPPYDFTWSPMLNPHLGDPERSARGFVTAIESVGTPWVDGPHLMRRTVAVTDWERQEAQ